MGLLSCGGAIGVDEKRQKNGAHVTSSNMLIWKMQALPFYCLWNVDFSLLLPFFFFAQGLRICMR